MSTLNIVYYQCYLNFCGRIWGGLASLPGLGQAQGNLSIPQECLLGLALRLLNPGKCPFPQEGSEIDHGPN